VVTRLKSGAPWNEQKPAVSARSEVHGSGRLPSMAAGRLRSIGSSNSAAVAPLSEEEELLRKLRTGEIDRPGYYDAMVELGLSQLRDRVTAEQLKVVRERMREEIETNPVLIRMVRDATGEQPESATQSDG
jgi:hypothetical protein